MKLGEVIRLIPKSCEFYVEVYKASNKNEIIYAYMVRPYDDKDRSRLNDELSHEVIAIRPSRRDAFYNGPIISIEIIDENY